MDVAGRYGRWLQRVGLQRSEPFSFGEEEHRFYAVAGSPDAIDIRQAYQHELLVRERQQLSVWTGGEGLGDLSLCHGGVVQGESKTPTTSIRSC